MPPHSEPDTPPRKRWMAILARADAETLAAHLRGLGELPSYDILRGPEVGMVMVRGRAGGSGAPFNLGEMSVTRCTVRTGAGHVGHAYVAGRDERRAELAALGDALMQDAATADRVEAEVIAPLEAAQQAARDGRAAKAAATKVQFFSMRTMRT